MPPDRGPRFRRLGEQVAELGADRAEQPGEADAREHVGARDADVGGGRFQRRFGCPDVGAALQHRRRQRRRQRHCARQRCALHGDGGVDQVLRRATQQDAERVGALDDFALELMHRDPRRRGIGLGALERELVALAGIEADLLQPQRFLARRQRVATASELLGGRDQPEIAARDFASQAELGRLAAILRVQQLRARRFGGALIACPTGPARSRPRPARCRSSDADPGRGRC